MPDIGDQVTATLTVSPYGVSTDADLTVRAPNGTVTTPAATTADGGETWTATVTYTMAGWWLLEWTITGTGAGTEFERVFVPDSPTAGTPPVYATLEQLKLTLTKDRNALVDREELLNQALLGASRGIDAYCGRRFYRDSAAVARTLQPRLRTVRTGDGDLLLIDDLATTSGLIVEVGSVATGWTAVASYETSPDTALYDGWPVTGLLAAAGTWSPTATSRARITGRWGWPSIPDVVVQATLMQAARLYRRKDSPEGVSGSSEWGLIRVPNMDPDVRALLAPLVRPGVG